ncbi:nicotinate phosphoribosyltransferase [Deinococcus metallilatus]|uniref:Nicotinate phosphoribosyltransferase n=1 Tax=Deinococcus metallilatus TaxID=1211322 RepID=A0AAJ5F6X5_9DEIO|nr:nicotinate phosphoribosyltransferase [Deinococcus metallilatus]MBB5296592.1 nicotinate phosphoribosyltransferase [Deinococcus metallilatus]QBY08387.1 nicotinate phosphoribosyltransferase [Deinococcus metallilatus]RXJ11186.1 nicotinate phosphoribosyltransferase [Deinococcus metallilatus]TLK24677.1 nicotinate phosphoribosyltransferase [Deinococcus metallilatus]GMA17509.1 nicotinate phosphoribosyltransferase [Deinococcus metallilatus]
MTATASPPAPSALFTDLYQLTMMQGYFAYGLHREEAVFDLYFRRPPFHGGFAVWAGLEPALDLLERLRFTGGDLAYLESLGLFRPDFLTALRGWKFTGRVTAFREGSVVFAHEPLLTVTAPLWEAQLVETALLNTLNFQTLVATKAARCVLAAEASPHGGQIVEFGARRAQGPNGAVSAARAAFVGGAVGTSNVEAGREFGLPLTGTHAHAWVESFPDELAAFRAYAALYPDSTTLLLDTVDTLRSGLPNALTVARELRAAGHELRGVRLDSGDLAYLSRRIRAALDTAGFPEVKIVASNDLSESVIASVIAEGGRVDVYGVGTQLATAGGEGGGALGGVFKLAQLGGVPKMKLTGDPAKSSLPGVKQVWRAVGEDGEYALDVLTLGGAPREGERVSDPTNPLRFSRLPGGLTWQNAREVVLEGGRRTGTPETLQQAQARARADLARLPEGTRRALNPHIYRVGLGDDVAGLRDRVAEALRAHTGA